MESARDQDAKMLLGHGTEKLLELFFLHIRNVWRVDGLYFLGIEEKFGTETATDIDAYCHKALGSIEAKTLVKALELKQRGIPDLVAALRRSCWALDLQNKSWDVQTDRAVLTVTECATQLTRLKKGLPVFPCQRVRQGYLEAFVEAFNPSLQCICKFCPPGERPANAWCSWEFVRRQGQ